MTERVHIVPYDVGVRQVFEKTITSAANAGAVTVGTINNAACMIESLVIHANAAQTADLTSCPVTGGASGIISFISALDATQANLNAADKQVVWTAATGPVRLALGKTIVITLNGTGATAVNLTVSIIYYSSSGAGGTIS